MGKARQRARRRKEEERLKALGLSAPATTGPSSTSKQNQTNSSQTSSDNHNNPALAPLVCVVTSSAETISKAIDWMQDGDAVKSWLNGWDLVDALEASDGLIRVINFLPNFVAQGILEAIKALPKDRWDVREDKDDTRLNTTQHRFLVANSLDEHNDDSTYDKDSSSNSANNKQKKGKNKAKVDQATKDPLTLINRFFASLFPGKRCSFSAAEYSSGDHITKHDDHAYVMHTDANDVSNPQPIKCSRDVAVIYYVNPMDWSEEEDGGMLVDLVDGQRYVPKFNSLVAFMVPRLHEVTRVRERCGREPRRSIFGWFLEPGDIYKFVADTPGGKEEGEEDEEAEEDPSFQRRKRSRFDLERGIRIGGMLSHKEQKKKMSKKRSKKTGRFSGGH